MCGTIRKIADRFKNLGHKFLVDLICRTKAIIISRHDRFVANVDGL